MKKKQLEMQLERLEGFSNRQPIRSSMNSACAADLLYLAYLHGDLESVCDLVRDRCSAIGSALLGANVVEWRSISVSSYSQRKRIDWSRSGVHKGRC